MQREFEERMANSYGAIRQSVHGVKIDPLEVLKHVEEFRQYWKPDKTNVILLAESHVYTDEKDSKNKLSESILRNLLTDYPLHFVRFVYCLGYGENQLLTGRRSDLRNTGTPLYWKIFSSCVADDEDHLGFGKILKTETRSFIVRLHNKVKVLQKLRKKGVWLLDASIVGLYGSGKKDLRMLEKVLEICWKNCIKGTILEAGPKHIIVIGKGVGDILYYKLHGLKIPFTVIPQPQARGTSDYQSENYKKYQRICARY